MDNASQDISLYIFGPTNEFRKICTLIVNNKIFQLVVLFSILISSLQLAIESPLTDP